MYKKRIEVIIKNANEVIENYKKENDVIGVISFDYAYFTGVLKQTINHIALEINSKERINL